MPGSRLFHALTLCGYFGTLVLVIAWYGWLAPAHVLPTAIVLMLFCIPLLLPLRGLLHGRRYTVAWSCFIALLYFIHGVVEAYSNEAARSLALLEIAFSSLWFVSAILYIRTQPATAG